jgi:F-type H+-transporting ATPase subunit a
MTLAALLLAAALQTSPGLEPTPQAPPPPQASPSAASAVEPERAPGTPATREASPQAGETEQAAGEQESTADVLFHHVLDGPDFGLPSKHLLYFVLAALVVLVAIRDALSRYDAKRVPSGAARFVEMIVLFIRDDVAEKSIGHDGRRFTPLLCSFFFFILFAAFLGLVPIPGYAHGRWSLAGITSTGNIAVTMALALVSFVAQQWAGIAKYGLVRHFANLVPPGLPVWLLPIMIPIEFLSMFTKPFALMVRLFANMLAGHMVITALLLLIPLMAQISTWFGLAVIPVSLGLALFIMLLEILVAFIQAYIFTLLTAIFIGMYAHPAH